MVLSEVILHQFRSHHEVAFQFDPKVTFIHGPNGIGKTNILEAIHILFSGKSFRDNDEDLIEFHKNWWRVEGIIDDTVRDMRYDPTHQRSKQLFIDGASKGRFTYKQQLPVVLFEPDDLLMVHGSPSLRRSYIDNCILALSPTYRQTLSNYERTLLQRNNLLKNKNLSPAERKDNLFVWDVKLSELGAEIMHQRILMIDKFNQLIGDLYSRIADKQQTIQLTYETKSHLPASSSTLLQELHHSLSHDLLRGVTTTGPHRDDMDIILNRTPAKNTASRGEVRSILLALKVAYAQFLEEAFGTVPIILLDDVFSELDNVRQAKLIDLLSSNQVIATGTDKPNWPGKLISL